MIDLRELFHGLQEQMQVSLNINRKYIEHPGSKGDATEQHWIVFYVLTFLTGIRWIRLL